MAQRGGRRRGQSQSLTDRLPLKLGAAFGAAAYVVGYIITYVMVEFDDEINTNELSGEIADTTDLVGWVFYNAHFVDTEFSRTLDGTTETETERLIAENTTQIPDLVYTLVPIVLLIGAGYLLLQRSYVTGMTDAALSGAGVVVGYLPLAVLGTFLFEASESVQTFGGEASVSIGPEAANAIVLAGIIFPVLFGAVGGFLAFKTQDNRRGGVRR